MKGIIIILISLIGLSSTLFSQNNINQVISEIERNNTSLIALQKSVEAQKIGNKTGIFLQNPELEFNYLWGNPSVIGNRTDIRVTQSFDFPTAYKYKSQISTIKNEQSELEYRKQQQSIHLQARITCYDLVYLNALKAELNKRLEHTRSIAMAFKRKFDLGEANILEYNKAQLNLLSLSKEQQAVEVEQNALLSDLQRLNGGKFIAFSDSVFPIPEIPADFEQWYSVAEQKNPTLAWLKQEIELSQKQLSLNKAMNLPKLQTGYMSENSGGQQFQGVTVGLSIPLWENRNTVKYAHSNLLAIQSIETDQKLQFYNQLKALHAKAIGLQNNAKDYRLLLLSYDNSKFLQKALDKGEITLIEYILELSIYYDSVNKLLESEKEMNKTVAELNQYM